ncbi:uncharacterized protein BO80DRAFT_159260 [Aspergillus ibericus CBS 121593]|uniref:Uncharacterized protein n=1 Tax=Aspergillus ibericus CBS 121593 TaxID=1448316 RepID=A0A395GUJ2_9EURO|nr:hypothetical protein BO80DRAFT_159260 [Aspergillus ibericus CBS 121593]RAK98327.1 hypothetical protein BO80DRAFT_159260 [Aspergillus ibericus CBS 121593]
MVFWRSSVLLYDSLLIRCGFVHPGRHFVRFLIPGRWIRFGNYLSNAKDYEAPEGPLAVWALSCMDTSGICTYLLRVCHWGNISQSIFETKDSRFGQTSESAAEPEFIFRGMDSGALSLHHCSRAFPPSLFPHGRSKLSGFRPKLQSLLKRRGRVLPAYALPPPPFSSPAPSPLNLDLATCLMRNTATTGLSSNVLPTPN